MQNGLENTVFIIQHSLSSDSRQYCGEIRKWYEQEQSTESEAMSEKALEADAQDSGNIYVIVKIIRGIGSGRYFDYVGHWYGYTEAHITVEIPRHII